MRLPLLPCLLLPALVLAGCASAPRLYVEEAAEPPACSQFGWFMPGDQPETFVDQRMRTEVMGTLAAKGYAVAGEDPDCLVAYRLVTETRSRSGPSVGLGMGGGSGRVGGGVGVSLPMGESSSASGRLSLDVIDAARNAQVWSGTLDKATRSAEPTVEEIRAAVQQILAAFPDR